MSILISKLIRLLYIYKIMMLLNLIVLEIYKKNYKKQKQKKKKFRIQAYDLIMCRYFFIWFIDFMLAVKTLTEFTNFFSPNNLKKMMI